MRRRSAIPADNEGVRGGGGLVWVDAWRCDGTQRRRGGGRIVAAAVVVVLVVVREFGVGVGDGFMLGTRAKREARRVTGSVRHGR